MTIWHFIADCKENERIEWNELFRFNSKMTNGIMPLIMAMLTINEANWFFFLSTLFRCIFLLPFTTVIIKVPGYFGIANKRSRVSARVKKTNKQWKRQTYFNALCHEWHANAVNCGWKSNKQANMPLSSSFLDWTNRFNKSNKNIFANSLVCCCSCCCWTMPIQLPSHALDGCIFSKSFHVNRLRASTLEIKLEVWNVYL